MKTLIIDDRKSIREFIVQLLSSVDGIEIVGEAENVATAIKQINTLKPELILLDIQMPDGNGFEVLEGTDFSNYKVIFVTSHEEFAIKAFKYSALDYIVKPIEPELFYAAIEKAKNNFDELFGKVAERESVVGVGKKKNGLLYGKYLWRLDVGWLHRTGPYFLFYAK